MTEYMCARCGESKSLDCFSKRPNGKPAAYCKPCRVDYHREIYAKNRDKILVRAVRNRRASMLRGRAAVVEYLKEHPCVDCGESDLVVLDFDHRDPRTKAGIVSMMVATGVGLVKIMAEIAKCDIRCANCHRRKTAEDCNAWRCDVI